MTDIQVVRLVAEILGVLGALFAAARYIIGYVIRANDSLHEKLNDNSAKWRSTDLKIDGINQRLDKLNGQVLKQREDFEAHSQDDRNRFESLHGIAQQNKGKLDVLGRLAGLPTPPEEDAQHE